jgi:hypothetical protein
MAAGLKWKSFFVWLWGKKDQPLPAGRLLRKAWTTFAKSYFAQSPKSPLFSNLQ